jgi:hypothetical protein
MGNLVTTCPTTGLKIETGIDTDRDSLDLTPPFVASIACPHCGGEHQFSKSDMLVCEMVDGVVQYLRAA